MTPKRIAVAFLVFALASPGGASAMLVTWELEGTLEQVGPWSIPGSYLQLHADELIPQLEAAGVAPGAVWRARIRFDTDVSADPCDECLGGSGFAGATTAIDFRAGSFAASTPDGAAGNAFTQSNGSYTDALAFESPMANGAPGLVADSAGLYLWSLHADVFFPTPLPIEPPELSALAGPTVGMYGLIFGTRFNLLGRGLVRNSDTAIFVFGGPPLVEQVFAIDGRITSITRVPEPSLLALVFAAAAAIAIRRCSRALP